MSIQFWFPHVRRRRSHRYLWRGFHLVAATLLGWLLSTQFVQSQEVQRHDPPLAIGCWSENTPAALAFWHVGVPIVQTPITAPVIQKPAFRYGDFGATSYPIRHSATGYYQSRVDWVWN